ncbi:MAG: CinA family protein [Rhodospirillaceae bacterium]|jgi:nicotinamide-nucleotide amidase|nr:CinA family protein [Rhodospirillaceae bacterium]MBT5245407.1 CinA family protein [Rhodospirillaceae bacterium]MBT5562563.1 CinA family protein [Rhodospirillaceae bacterium]MBT6242579.1 CinA family protein [Rhodospirillaceae bacterium]MBT7137228.1 CinA family protein [Rhodospirillaceae bacterium]
MFNNQLMALAEDVIKLFKAQNLHLATAESCTGGLIAGCLTAVAGASEVLTHGYVTYANQAKINLLGITQDQLVKHGAVSETVSRAMAEGAISDEHADVAVSVTGIAGPGGGSAEKPVGLVYISVAQKGQETLHERHVFSGDRNAVRLQTIEAAFRLILSRKET